MIEGLRQKLRDMTGKRNVVLTRRGNVAIRHAFDIAKDQGYITVVAPDQGIWMRAAQIAAKAGLRWVEMKTDDGVIDVEALRQYRNCILFVQTYAGYFAPQDMETIRKVCDENKLFLIEDATPALGDKLYGDVIVASFGEGKPLNLGTGGIIAYDVEVDVEESFGGDEEKLLEKIDQLPSRMEYLKKAARLAKQDLKDFNILHRDGQGINVVIAYENESQKNYITNYCQRMNIEYTECPRYIRVNSPAISMEIKRLV